MKCQDLIELQTVLQFVRNFILDTLQKNKLETRRKHVFFPSQRGAISFWKSFRKNVDFLFKNWNLCYYKYVAKNKIKKFEIYAQFRLIFCYYDDVE